MPHFLHIFGIGVACLVNNVYAFEGELVYQSLEYPQTYDLNALLSSLLAALLLCGFLYNIYAQKGRNLYNYKMSLDPNIQREIGSNQILLLKYFPIDTIQSSGSVGENRKKQIALPLYGIITKLQSLLFIYSPFHCFNHLISIDFQVSNPLEYIGPVLGIVGIITSIFLLWLLQYKSQYAVMTSGQILYFIIWIIILAVNPAEINVIKILTWITFLFFAMSRPHADINILSYTSIKFTDLYLGLGYFIEMMIVGLLQYHGIVNWIKVFGPIDGPFEFIAGNAITFCIILVILLVVGLMLLPGEEFMSLLEIKNWINDGRPHNAIHDVPSVETVIESSIPNYIEDNYEYENQFYHQSQYYQRNSSTAPSAPPITEL